MLNAFYGAFAPACFALLGLWLVVVQIRMDDWRGSVFHLKQSYSIALHFALPGVMALASLIDPRDATFWRVSFVIIALGGAVILVMVSRRPAQPPEAAAPTALSRLTGQLSLAAYLLAILLYVLVAALAFARGSAVLRAEAFLLIGLVFLGFNAAWLLMFDERQSVRSAAADRESTVATAPGSQPEVQSP